MCLNAKNSIARQHDDIILSDIDKTLQGSKIYLCAKFGYSAPGCVRVGGQKQTCADFKYCRFWLWGLIPVLCCTPLSHAN